MDYTVLDPDILPKDYDFTPTPIPGLVGKTWRESPIIVNKKEIVAFPNFELDWDYPSNDPFGNKHWRNKWIWEKVMIKRKGDGRRFLIGEDTAFSALGIIYHKPGLTLDDYYYEFAFYYCSPDGTQVDEECSKLFFEGETMFTFVTDFFYSMAYAANERIIQLFRKKG